MLTFLTRLHFNCPSACRLQQSFERCLRKYVLIFLDDLPVWIISGKCYPSILGIFTMAQNSKQRRTRLGLECQTPVQVIPLPYPFYKASSSEALFSHSIDHLSLKFNFGQKILSLTIFVPKKCLS